MTHVLLRHPEGTPRVCGYCERRIRAPDRFVLVGLHPEWHVPIWAHSKCKALRRRLEQAAEKEKA